MVFSSPVFLLIFLPATLFFTLILPRRFQNIMLLIASLIFYAWGGVSFSLIMLSSIVINFIAGRQIEKRAGKQGAKNALIIGLVLNLLLLGVFKYANFFVDNLNVILGWADLTPITMKPIYLPIGISFFTFQAISYIVDVYRKETPAQKNPVDLALYIALFPQLIAGPIVRYHDIAYQLRHRIPNLEKFASGVERFIIGLAKKVLIANTMAQVADNIFGLELTEMSTATAWLGAIAYSFQIYFDFSGYSDMAIGLGRMFGFEILENFNFPYISKSIREFWRRWHISLSTWFRDYLYIPLGGNRVSQGKVFRNLLIVFFLTGFWHGAAWNFVVWGMLHGFFLVIERVGFGKFMERLWSPFQHLYVLIVAIFAWVLFRADSLEYGFGFIKNMMGFAHQPFNWDYLLEYLNQEVYVVLIIATISSTTFLIYIQKQFNRFQTNLNISVNGLVNGMFSFISVAGLIILLVMCLTYLASSTYNPFIYYRF
ncbi:MAG: MBOAT family protein [Bacteroidales bacterium]|nr:MBOAT family protein [Bacteroidales bacterium]